MLVPYLAWLGSFVVFAWALQGAEGFGLLAALVLSLVVLRWLMAKRT